MWVWPLAGLIGFCSVAVGAGWAVGRWLYPRPGAGPGIRPRLLWNLLYALWCLSWLPSVVGMLSHTPGQRDTPEQAAIRLLCAANLMLYYVGGATWLAMQSRGASRSRVAAAWIVCGLLNAFGPVTLLLAKAILDVAPREAPT
jgi:hypothetical protein